jgi:hypothetical protein
MGGYNSGRRWDRKLTTSEYGHLDVREWARRGLLQAGRSFFWPGCHVQVLPPIKVGDRPSRLIVSSFWSNGRAPAVEHKCTVRMEWTRCNYGGFRPWFLCPVQACGRRAALVYLHYRYSGNLACRHCHRLSYRSQQETAGNRALSRAQAIRMSLGGSANCTEPFPEKPKGMHYNTSNRLKWRALLGEQEYLSDCVRFLARKGVNMSKLLGTNETGD